MGIQKGTKLTDNPKDKTFKIRLDDNTYNKLEYLSERKKCSKAEIIRAGIEIQYEKQGKEGE